MKFTAQQISDFLNGIIEGNPDIEVSSVSKIDAGSPGSLTFLANPAYTKYIYTTEASVVLVSKDFIPAQSISATLVKVDDPYSAFTKLLQMVQSSTQPNKTGIAATAVIHPSARFDNKDTVWIGDYAVIGENARIGDGARIYPHVFIDDHCIIGENSILYSGVKLYSHTQIGNSCIIHSGVVIGSDGFGFAPGTDGSYTKIPQLGNVIIEDNVEVGSNTTIDRATLGSTIIRQGTKLDNLIMVAHNCEIGKHTVVASQAGFSGSSKIGNNCLIGGQAGFSGHITVGNHVMIAAQSGIANNIKDKSVVMGSPAFDATKYKRAIVLFKNIEEMSKRIKALELKLKA
jgi:UDP-3-O-[3-hydroxymyristoyl] glucosamine N-acyltransferase